MLDMTLTQIGLFEIINVFDNILAILNHETDDIENILKDMAENIAEDAGEVTHQRTGALSLSHTASKREKNLFAVHSDPNVINPLEGIPAESYALEEHSRGGDHAFYEIVMQEYGQEYGEWGIERLIATIQEAG